MQDYDIQSLKLQVEEHLNSQPLASSTFHPRILPSSLCDDFARRYEDRGWQVNYQVSERGTVFSFLK